MSSVPRAFARQVALHPRAVAVAAGSQRLTYADLAARADRLARTLVAAGVRRGDRVAVCMERSPQLIVALLGVLMAGGAYVSIDPAEPERRRLDLLADCAPGVAVCDPDMAEALRSMVPVLPVDQDWPASGGVDQSAEPVADSVCSGDLAYLMYTSGSTGRPKAAMIEHGSITNLVLAPTYVRIGPDDRVLQYAPVAFDAATFEIWGALLNGAQLVLAPGELLPTRLGAFLRERAITTMWLTAALFHRQVDIDVGAFRGLRTLLAGGDTLSVPHVQTVLTQVPHCQLVNGYGPTEATTFSCCHLVSSVDSGQRSVPIGRPIQNVRVRVVDGSGVEVPDGTPGELWIGGAGVARGYWRRPELTSEKFHVDRDGRWYHSGDLVCRQPDGVIEFLGRADGQVKLRGFRIEPGEIESALAAHPQVRQAVVGLRQNALGDPRLVAWIVPAGTTGLDRRALRGHLARCLPSYMVPTVFQLITELPVTRNGKVDRDRLPDPDWRRRDVYA